MLKYEGVTILHIKITNSLIEFELVKVLSTYDLMLQHLTDQKNHQTKEIQKLIRIGEDGLENIDRFYKMYVENIGINIYDKTTSFYTVRVYDFIDF